MRLWVTRYDTTNLAIPGDVVVIDTVRAARPTTR